MRVDRQMVSQAAAALLLLGTLGWTSPGLAMPGKCLLSVDGKIYLNATCNIDISASDGSFSIGTGESSREKHFAVVNVGPVKRRAIGYWNGVLGEDRAHESLGILVRRGACWINARARICATRK